MRTLVESWSAIVVRGVVTLVFGVVALVWPGVTVGVLIGLFAAFTILYGLTAAFHALAARRQGESWTGDLLLAVVAIAAGVFVLVWPDLTAAGLLLAIGIFAVAGGVAELVVALALRSFVRRIWPLVLSGLVSVAFGVVLIADSGEGAVALAWLVGVYAIVFGASLIGFGLALRRLARGA